MKRLLVGNLTVEEAGEIVDSFALLGVSVDGLNKDLESGRSVLTIGNGVELEVV